MYILLCVKQLVGTCCMAQELSAGLCDGLEGRQGHRGAKEREDLSTLMADSPVVQQKPTQHCRAVQFSSVAQSCPTLCSPMYCSSPGLPVHHQLLEFIQTPAHRVGDAIQPSHPLSSPSPPAPNPSQHQGLFQ